MRSPGSRPIDSTSPRRPSSLLEMTPSALAPMSTSTSSGSTRTTIPSTMSPWLGVLKASWSSLTAYAKRSDIVRQNSGLSRIRQPQVVVVDQPGFADSNRENRKAPRRRECRRVDHLRVLELGQRLGFDGLEQGRTEPIGIPLPSAVRLGSMAERAAQADRGHPFAPAEIGVS